MSKDPTNSIQVLKEKDATKVKKTQKKQTTQNTAIRYRETHKIP